jgi:uncharacterized iron-regulated membrane protein
MILKIHLWLGLPLALYCLIMGATGAVLMFRHPIHAWQYPHFHSGPAPTFRANPDAAIARVQARYPDWKPLSLTWPHEHTPYWMVFLLKGPDGREIYVSTDTGEIIGEQNPRAGWFGVAERIHNNWYWGRNGRLLNGYGAVASVILSLTGLYLVWPRLKRLGLRSVRDWHYTLGVASFAFIQIVSFTGAYFTWGPAYIAFAKDYLGRRADPPLPPSALSTTLPLSRLAQAAQEALPGKPIQRLPMPNPKSVYKVALLEDRFDAFHRVSHVILDPRTGAVLAVHRLAERAAGDSFLGWVAALHFGNFGGAPVEYLWALLSLAMASLGPTGFWIWWRKR